MNRIHAFVSAAFLATALSTSAQSAIIADWNFETPIPTVTDSALGPVISASTGNGSFRGVHASSQSDWGGIGGNGSPTAYSGETNWTVGDYYQFSTSTTGYEGITVSVDQSSAGAGPRDFQLSYSTDGSTFTSFGPIYAIPPQSVALGTLWHTTPRLSNAIFSFDLSGISALDDAANVYFRITQMTTASAFGGSLSPNARSFIDNVTISGTAVPEPSSSLLLGAAALLPLLRRRRD